MTSRATESESTTPANVPFSSGGANSTIPSGRVRGALTRIGGEMGRLGFIAATVLAVTTMVGAPTPALAKPAPLTTDCKGAYLFKAGTSGRAAGFVVSMEPTWRARVIPAHGGTDAVWAELWGCVRYPAVTPRQGESLYQQLYCHIKYGYSSHFGGSTWDLEAFRPVIPWNEVKNGVFRHKCNWTSADRSS